MNTTFKLFACSIAALVLSTGAARAQNDKPAAAPASQPAADKTANPTSDQPKDGGKKDDDKKTTPETKNVPTIEYVKIATSKGDIYAKLDGAKAPISVENFLKYTDKKFYDGTIFHRVIPDFMVQGGGFTPDMKEKNDGKEKPIKNEWQNGLKNKRGTLAMARTQVADSATSQFFINVVDNTFLDNPRDGAAYAVFGEVVAGMEVVDAIQKVKTEKKGMYGDVPKETVTITSVTRVKEADVPKK